MVNGAFKKGRFKKFEDYNNIEGVKPIKYISEKLNDKSFMHSWSYPTQGISVDDWREMPFPVLLKAMPRRGMFEEKHYNLDFFCFDSTFVVPAYRAFKCSHEKPLEIELEDKQTILITDPTMSLPLERIPLPDDLESLTLRDFISTNPQEKTILYFANGDLTKPRLYRLKKNQRINNSSLK